MENAFLVLTAILGYFMLHLADAFLSLAIIIPELLLKFNPAPKIAMDVTH
jgi:hypothetical protein